MMLAKGEATLVLGQATVSLPRISADAVVVLSRKNSIGTTGLLNWAITPGTGFTITSANILDVSAVGWAVFS